MSEPNPDFKFRSGKYQGKTYKWVNEHYPNYVEWVKENQPNMLKEMAKTPIKQVRVNFGKIEPNLNFDDEESDLY